MKLEKKVHWVFPEGIHQARIISAGLYGEGNGKNDEELKIILQVTSLVHPLKQYRTRIIYWPQELRKFITDFTPIVGEEKVAALFNMEGELISEGLTCLSGLLVDIETFLDYRPGHAQPLNMVRRIKPRGELMPDFDQAA